MGVKEKALQVIRRERMLPPDCAVIVGLSGGADSVTLLHLFASLREEGVISHLQAVHINHSLRGEESRRDQQFVEALCRQWNIPLYTEQHDVASLAHDRGRGIEEVGRELRYEAFNTAAQRFPVYRIATAHTADDNAETLLLHICRGSGLHGAVGIPPVRGEIIRPLITCTREEIEAYCQQYDLSYVTDSTNADIAYARNRIRHTVMPQMRAINPKVTTAVTRFIEQVRQTDAFIEKWVKKAVDDAKMDEDAYSRHTLLALDEPLRSRALCCIVQTAEERHIRLLNTALEAGDGAVVLPGGTRWCVTQTALIPQSEVEDPYPEFCLSAVVGECYTIGNGIYRLMVLTREEYEQKLNICKYLFANALDYDKINGNLVLRQRKEGDAFHPVGRNCGKSLKKLFNERKTVSRDTVPILCDALGILLVFGLGCDKRVQISSETKTVLLVIKEDVYENPTS